MYRDMEWVHPHVQSRCRAHIHVHTHTHIVYGHVHTYIRIYIHSYIHLYMHKCTNMYIYTNMYMCVCMNECMVWLSRYENPVLKRAWYLCNVHACTRSKCAENEKQEWQPVCMYMTCNLRTCSITRLCSSRESPEIWSAYSCTWLCLATNTHTHTHTHSHTEKLICTVAYIATVLHAHTQHMHIFAHTHNLISTVTHDYA